MSKTIYLETTNVPSERTAAEISSVLAQSGASKVMMEYGPGGVASGITFGITRNGHDTAYKLPVRTEPIYRLLQSRRKHSAWKYKDADKQQADRIAWRQILRWVQAQLALVDTGMADIREVFTPYMLCDGQQTVYERILEQAGKLLPAPEVKS